jgi:DNA primase
MATERSAELIKEAFSSLGDIKQFDSCYAMSNDQYSCEIRVVAPPMGKDPDEFIRENGGNAYIEHMINAPLLLDYRLNKVLENTNKKMTPIEKNNIAKKIIPMLKEIKNNIILNEYVKKIATILEINEGLFLKEISAFRDFDNKISEEIEKPKSQIVTKSSNFIEKMQKNLISIFFSNISDNNRLQLIRTIESQKIENENIKLLVQTIDKILFKSNNTVDLTDGLFKEFEANNEIKHIITDLIYISKCYENLTEREIHTAILETTDKIELFRRKEELKKLKSESKEGDDSDKVQYQITVKEKLKNENWRN